MTPVLGRLGTDLYDELAPLANEDEQNGWALAYYLDAIGGLLDEVDSWARDGDNDEPGWSNLLDLTRAPTKALPWLGQFVGVYVPGSMDDASARNLILSHPGFQRGTLSAIVAAAQLHLTGTKDVLVMERYQGDPYKLYVATRTAQTPSPTQTQADIVAQKPAGLLLTYATITGQTFGELLVDSPLYSNVFSNYATFQGVLTGVHGT